MGTYVEAVLIEKYQPTVAQATEQPFFRGSFPHLPKLPIAAGVGNQAEEAYPCTDSQSRPTETEGFGQSFLIKIGRLF